MSRSEAIGIAVYDPATKTTYTAGNTATEYNTASVVKLTLLIGVLLDAQQDARPLTASEQTNLKNMISTSDNTRRHRRCTDSSVGLRACQSYWLALVRQTPPPASSWGLTTTTPSDQVLIMRQITEPNDLLADATRQQAKDYLAGVIPSQHWGISAASATNPNAVLLKNGWLPYNGGWIVNSVGYVNNPTHDYVMAVLTTGSTSHAAGIEAIEGAAEIARTAIK